MTECLCLKVQPWAESNCYQTLQEWHRKWWNHPGSGCLFGWLSWRIFIERCLSTRVERSREFRLCAAITPFKGTRPAGTPGQRRVQPHNPQKQYMLLIYGCIWSSGPLNSSSKVIRNKLYSRGMLQPLTRAINRADHICLAAAKRGPWPLTPPATGVIVVARSASLCASGTWNNCLGI